MNNLYNELTSSTSSTNEVGDVITYAPTSLSLRAARGLKQLSEQLQMAQQHSNACQQQAFEISQQLTITQNQVKELHAELQSLREGAKQPSLVASGGGELPGRDVSSPGNSASEASSSVD